MTYTQTQLTELAEQKPDEFVRMIAEVCYKWKFRKGQIYADAYTDGSNYVIDVKDFNPLANTEAGRSQAFELADKFGIEVDFPFDEHPACASYRVSDLFFDRGYRWDGVVHKDPQAAIVIAAILTAQEK